MSHSAANGFLPLITTSRQNSANAISQELNRRARPMMSIEGLTRPAVGSTVTSATVSVGAIAVMLPLRA